MSNDAKFWAWRIAIVVNLVINLYILGQICKRGMNAEPMARWVVAFFVLMVASIALGFMYTLAKRRRWESSVSPFEDLEPLNAYTKMQMEDKAKAAVHVKERSKK